MSYELEEWQRTHLLAVAFNNVSRYLGSRTRLSPSERGPSSSGFRSESMKEMIERQEATARQIGMRLNAYRDPFKGAAKVITAGKNKGNC